MAEYHERAAKLGGAITKAKYGVSHFATIGRAGGLKVKNRGTDYKAIGKKGAATARANVRNAALQEAALLAANTCSNTSGGCQCPGHIIAARIWALRTT